MCEKNNFPRRSVSALLTILFVLVIFAASPVKAQTTVFTYQGRLNDASAAANGIYDLQFKLYDAAGNQIGAAQIKEDVSVSNGIFTVQLDAALFGANAFDGGDRTLEIAVRRGAETGAFTVLAPRQPITSAPYAIRAPNATNADNAATATRATNAQTAATAQNAQQLGGVAASNFTQNNSQAFIRNQTTQQTADFNINGTGAANVFDVATQYNIGGNRVLISPGNFNFFAGVGVGAANTGSGNSFVGTNAGNANTTGGGNAFFGSQTGQFNTTGERNSFFGEFAGLFNTTGNYNSFIGEYSGQRNTTGSSNTFVGRNAGQYNTTGSNNTLIGADAAVVSGALTYATAIGAGARIDTSNSIVLGRFLGEDTVFIPGAINANGLITASGAINASGLITASGGVSVQNSSLFLRSGGDPNHRISYNSSIDGIRFTAYGGFQWFNAPSNLVVMQLTGSGDLTIRGSLGQNSDARYKTNVQTFTNALDAVRRLRGVTFNWKPEQNSNQKTQIGFIAQEVEQVLPEIVSTDQNGYKSVAYANAVPVLVEAVKEQQIQIERQQKQLAEQQIVIDGLRKLVCSQNPTADICK